MLVIALDFLFRPWFLNKNWPPYHNLKDIDNRYVSSRF